MAVPAPLPEPLDYLVPPSLRHRALPGARVRVPLGRRRLTGLVVERHDRVDPALEGRLKPIEAMVDQAPVLPAELLDLGRFVSDYYLAAPGEVFRAMLPSRLEGWGNQRIWLTDRGALARGRSEAERTVLEALTQAGRSTLGELEAALADPDFYRTVETLRSRGWLTVAESRTSGARYVTAVELGPGSKESLLEKAGRSGPGRRAIEHLAAAGRPMLRSELEEELGCSPSVLRRLAKLGAVRTFTQVARLDLDHHRMATKPPAPIVLRPDQDLAATALVDSVGRREFAPCFLGGMTGSGKTEVYLRAVQAVLDEGGSAIILVPEIALVPALAETLRRRFGTDAAILHSALSPGERQQEWERLRAGSARLVLGPRSAIFAPVQNLRLIVVDEEHDTAYKQEVTPRYNARDVALWRGRDSAATVVLVSATPSLESRLNLQRGRLRQLELTERVGVGRLPEAEVVDLRTVEGPRRPGEIHISEPLMAALEDAFRAGDQAIVLRNRRGYSPVLLCRACGEDLRCDDCGLPRTFHKRFGELQCHYCGSKRPRPERCPACSEPALEPIGSGTERVDEQFRELFPEIETAVLDRDTVRSPGGVPAVLERFGRGDAQVLIGTQMVAKGHHFPKVALAAVLQADTYLSFPDFRAVERTYNLLTQLAGRAGRGDRPGRVVVQTYHPDHYGIRAALSHDDAGFAAEEMRFRRIFHYPPYTRMIQLLIRDARRERGAATAERLANDLGVLAGREPEAGIRLAGPAPAPFERLRGKWRFQILIRGRSASALKRLAREAVPERSPSEIILDVDPLELL